jgi:hypothetical protein
MNELRRMAYLDAMGVDSYVSRNQLPGAAPTRRLAIAPTGTLPRSAAAPVAVKTSALATVAVSTSAVATAAVSTAAVSTAAATPRFSLVAIVAGDWLWLEELVDMALTTEQVRLVQAMAQALLLSGATPNRRGGSAATVTTEAQSGETRPRVAQFDWPIHTNQQLDLGVQAARASVAGFVGRRLEEYGCRGLVLLGQSCAERVPVQELSIATVCTASSAQMLAQPALKRAVWRDLLPLVSSR